MSPRGQAPPGRGRRGHADQRSRGQGHPRRPREETRLGEQAGPDRSSRKRERAAFRWACAGRGRLRRHLPLRAEPRTQGAAPRLRHGRRMGPFAPAHGKGSRTVPAARRSRRRRRRRRSGGPFEKSAGLHASQRAHPVSHPPSAKSKRTAGEEEKGPRFLPLSGFIFPFSPIP